MELTDLLIAVIALLTVVVIFLSGWVLLLNARVGLVEHERNELEQKCRVYELEYEGD